jgi:hypothetical protein
MSKTPRFSLNRLALSVLVMVSASAQPKTVSSPALYPTWFLQPKELGVVSWEDNYGNGEGGLFDRDRGNYVYQFHTSLSGKELISRVDAWAHAQSYELIERTADAKIVASEFDSSKDPVGAAKRAMARGHTRFVSVEMDGDDKVSMTVGEGTLH